MHSRSAFTLIELLVVIAIIAILAVVVVLTLNPAELLRQSRDANRVSDIATITNALNLYTTDQSGASSFSLGNASDTYPSVYDPSATSTAGDQCTGLDMLSLNTSTGQTWQCAPSSTYRSVNNTGWIPVNLSKITAGTPIGSLPVDPTNQTSSGLFYAYNTNGTQFEVTANLESQKYKSQFGQTPNTNYFPEVISGGTPTVSALYNPNGLVGYWPLNEGSGSSTIDVSGNGDNGTWSGTPTGNNGTYYVGGKVGNYAGYWNTVTPDGDSIGNPTALQITGPITVSAWVNEAAGDGAYIRAISNFVGGSVNTGPFAMQFNGINAASVGCIFNNGGMVVTSGVGSVNSGIWTQVACAYNGSSVTVYVNGVAASSTSYSSGLSYTNGWPWRIGSDGSSTPGDIFTGDIDDVRIYSRALSAEEIMALYTAEK